MTKIADRQEFMPGQVVIIDQGSEIERKVTVIEQSPKRVFTKVQDDTIETLSGQPYIYETLTSRLITP